MLLVGWEVAQSVRSILEAVGTHVVFAIRW